MGAPSRPVPTSHRGSGTRTPPEMPPSAWARAPPAATAMPAGQTRVRGRRALAPARRSPACPDSQGMLRRLLGPRCRTRRRHGPHQPSSVHLESKNALSSQIRAFGRGLPDFGDRGARRWLVVRISGWRLWGRGSGGGRSRGLPPVLCGTHLARSDAGLLGGRRGRVFGGSGWSGAHWEPDRAGWPVQQESTATGADLTGRARTSWDGDLHRRTAVDVLPADGMQEVRGSNPLSSTQVR